LGKERAEKTKELTCQRGNSRASAKVEELVYGEKIAKALASCEAYLEKAIAVSKGACEESDSWMWHASAELEYALFLFSLKSPDEDVTLKCKSWSHDRTDSATTLLNTVQNLLVQSKESIAAENWLRARKHAYAAGNILLGLQREHARKKRGSIGK
jgi:hypothetical protein